MIIFIGCTRFNLASKYGIESKPTSISGKSKSNSEYGIFNIEKAFYINNCYLEDSLFSTTKKYDGMSFSQTKNIVKYIIEGDETYLMLYRNYIGFCCDDVTEFSFYVLVNLVDNKPNKNKSIILDLGGQLPYYTLNPDTISLSENRLIFIGIDRDEVKTYFDISFIIDNSYSLNDYFESLEN